MIQSVWKTWFTFIGGIVAVVLLVSSIPGAHASTWSINRTSQSFSLYRYSTHIYQETRDRALLLATADTSPGSSSARYAQVDQIPSIPPEDKKKINPFPVNG
jgi:hypothetical protein